MGWISRYSDSFYLISQVVQEFLDQRFIMLFSCLPAKQWLCWLGVTREALRTIQGQQQKTTTQSHPSGVTLHGNIFETIGQKHRNTYTPWN